MVNINCSCGTKMNECEYKPTKNKNLCTILTLKQSKNNNANICPKCGNIVLKETT